MRFVTLAIELGKFLIFSLISLFTSSYPGFTIGREIKVLPVRASMFMRVLIF